MFPTGLKLTMANNRFIFHRRIQTHSRQEPQLEGWAECKICRFRWGLINEQRAETDDCQRCHQIMAKYPDLVEWVLGVIQEKEDKHISDYQHNYSEM